MEIRQRVTLALAAALALFLAPQAFAGGAAEQPKAGTGATGSGLEWSRDTSPITIEHMVNFSWFGMDWSDPTARRVTERTGVTLKITKPVADDNQKLNLMIAGGSLPEMLTLGRTDASLPLMVSQGMLWPLDEIMDTYCPKMRGILPEELLANYRAPDGKTYQLTTWVQGKAWQKAAREYNQVIGTNQQVFSVRTDYWEEAGKPDMGTPEGFIAALVKMKARHPDKIGFYPADTAMLASTWEEQADLHNIGVQFGLSGDRYADGGAIKWAVRSPRFLAAVRFLNELYRKGLLTRDPFIDTKDVQKAKIEQGEVIAYSWTIGDGEKAPGDNPATSYRILKPFPTYQQVRTGAGWLATVITRKAKSPKRAITFLEYLASEEGHRDVSWGVEGAAYGDVVVGPHWHRVNGKPTFFPEYVREKSADWGGVASRNGLGEYWLACNELLWNLPWWDPSDKKMAGFNAQFGPLVVFRPDLDLGDPDPASAEGIILQNAFGLLRDASVKLIFTEDPGAEYNRLVAALDSLDLAKVEQYWTAGYQAKLKSMGK
jgi:putative aldouronate transport system substrate-binding protein